MRAFAMADGKAVPFLKLTDTSHCLFPTRDSTMVYTKSATYEHV